MKEVSLFIGLGLFALVPSLSFAESYECKVVNNTDFEEYTLTIDFERTNLQESKTSFFDNDSWVDASFKTVLRSYPAQFVFSADGVLGYTAVVKENRKGMLTSAVVSFDNAEGGTTSIAMKCALHR